MKIVLSDEELSQTGGKKKKGRMKMKGGMKMNGEKKTTYLRMCNQLLDNNDEESREVLLSYLEEDCRNAVNTLYPEDKHDQLHSDLTSIFSSINKSDPDNIGMVNIVSLQVGVLFTFACIDFKDITEKNIDYFNRNSTGKELLEFINQQQYTVIDPSKDWRNYNYINKSCKILEDFYISEGAKNAKYLIVVIDYLTLDEVVIPYLDNKFFCGITYTKTYADGKLLVPFLFIDHDKVHASNFVGLCFSRMTNDRTEMKNFYLFLGSTSSKLAKNACKMTYFIKIHEDFCDIFDEHVNITTLHNPKNSYYNAVFRQERLFNDDDLGLLIPRPYRVNNQTRLNYFIFSVKIYLDAIRKFKAGESIFEPDEAILASAPAPPAILASAPAPAPAPPAPPAIAPSIASDGESNLLGRGGNRKKNTKKNTKKRRRSKKTRKPNRRYK